MFTMKARWDGASLTDLAVPGGSILMGLSLVTGSDRTYDQLAKITLVKSSESKPTIVEMVQVKDKLLTPAEVEAQKKK
jgi:hypothetical protein